MFRCDECKSVSPPKIQPIRCAVDVRERVYLPRVYRHKGIEIEDPGGRGSEIVKEHRLCLSCAEKKGLYHRPTVPKPEQPTEEPLT